jgi:predicted PurR-regulated permease PerM
MLADFKRRTTFVVAVCAGVVVAAMLVWATRVILLLIFAGLLGALLLTVITDWMRDTLRLRRSLAFSLVVALIAVGLGLGIWMRGSAVVQQFSDLQIDLPTALHQVLLRLEAQSWGHWLLSRYAGWEQLSGGLSYLLTRVGGVVITTASIFIDLFVVVAVSLYVAAEPSSYLRIIHYVTPPAYQRKLDSCLASAAQLLRSWLLAKAISMISIGVFIALGLWALQVPLAGTLGFIAALLTFVPNLGPVLSVVPAALLAFAISPTKGILTLLLFGFAHFLEGNIVTPLLERKIVTLPPALTLAVQLLLASLTGAIGVVLAAPLTAAILGILMVLHPGDPQHPPQTLGRDRAAGSHTPPVLLRLDLGKLSKTSDMNVKAFGHSPSPKAAKPQNLRIFHNTNWSLRC